MNEKNVCECASQRDLLSTAESPKHSLSRHIFRSFSVTHKDERGAGLNKIE